jgi:oxalate decarboxylase/phosphoglucose isomerase-like protein (cupin superfamily)
MQITKFKFHERGNDTGDLVFLESCRDIPFEIKRVYYIYGVKEGTGRGYHAHKELNQVLICVHGSCTVMLDNGKEKTHILLDDPSEGLFVGKATWREMYDFTLDAVLLVLASEYYDERDYIRDYTEFIRYLEEMGG